MSTFSNAIGITTSREVVNFPSGGLTFTITPEAGGETIIDLTGSYSPGLSVPTNVIARLQVQSGDSGWRDYVNISTWAMNSSNIVTTTADPSFVNTPYNANPAGSNSGGSPTMAPRIRLLPNSRILVTVQSFTNVPGEIIYHKTVLK